MKVERQRRAIRKGRLANGPFPNSSYEVPQVKSVCIPAEVIDRLARCLIDYLLESYFCRLEDRGLCAAVCLHFVLHDRRTSNFPIDDDEC